MRDIEVYYLKMNKVIRKIRNFNDLFNEELKAKLSNYKVIYSQLAELGVLIVHKSDGKVLPTKIISINNTSDSEDSKINIRLFGLDINKLNEVVKKYIEDNEFLNGVNYKNISDEISTIYQKLSYEQINDELNNLIKYKFNIKSLDGNINSKLKDKIDKYIYGFKEGIKIQEPEIYFYLGEGYEFIFQSNTDIELINKEIELVIYQSNIVDKENKYEKAGFIEGLRINIKQGIAQAAQEKIENKTSVNNEDDSINEEI